MTTPNPRRSRSHRARLYALLDAERRDADTAPTHDERHRATVRYGALCDALSALYPPRRRDDRRHPSPEVSQ